VTRGVAALRIAEDHDRAGREREAVPKYLEAIGAGLDDPELAGALHGLGSTYRALGRYDEAEATLREGMARFPDDATFAPFLAMTLYNLGRAREAVVLLLTTLVDTTGDPRINAYERAIRLYAADLDRCC